MRGRARRGLRARMGVREGWEAAGRLRRAWVGRDPAGAEPRAGSHSSDSRRSQLCARGIGELEGRRRWGCCCYCDCRGRCGGLRRFKVSGSAPRGRCRGWRVGNPRGSRGARRTGHGEGLGESLWELPRDSQLQLCWPQGPDLHTVPRYPVSMAKQSGRAPSLQAAAQHPQTPLDSLLWPHPPV